MTRPVDLQFYAFFVMVLAGAALGASYDVYRALRGVCRRPGLLGAVADMLFGLVASLLLGLALLLGNWGELRVYVAVGVGIGLALYHEFGAHLFSRAARRGFGTLAAVSHKLSFAARFAVRKTGAMAGRPVRWGWGIAARRARELLGRLRPRREPPAQ